MSNGDERHGEGRYELDDYMNAPSGIGPLADEWKDKPHRLVYDLVGRLRAKPTPSSSDPLEVAVRRLLASRWVRATVSALSNLGMSSPAGRTELAQQEAIFVEIRDALAARDALTARSKKPEACLNCRLTGGKLTDEGVCINTRVCDLRRDASGSPPPRRLE